MDNITKAVEYFKQGFNCCQSILLTYGKELGFDRETAIKVGHAFGGGIARTGETCGAVAGAIMIIGLKYGKTEVVDEASDTKILNSTTQFIMEFEEKHNSSICLELINLDISTPEGHEKALREGIFKFTCPKMVETAAGILEKILSDY